MAYTSTHQDELAQYDSDLAEDELNRIERIKEDVVGIIDAARAVMSDKCFSLYAATMEEAFDESFHDMWKKSWEICRTINREQIPSCETLRAKLAKEKRNNLAARMSANNQGVNRFRANTEAHMAVQEDAA